MPQKNHARYYNASARWLPSNLASLQSMLNVFISRNYVLQMMKWNLFQSEIKLIARQKRTFIFAYFQFVLKSLSLTFLLIARLLFFFIRSCLWHHEHFEIIFPIIYNINRFQYCLSRRWWADGIVSTTYQSKTMKTFWKLSVGLWEGIGSLLTKFGADSWLNFIMINATIARYIPSFHALPSTTEGR